jgi:hypothetical protein
VLTPDTIADLIAEHLDATCRNEEWINTKVDPDNPAVVLAEGGNRWAPGDPPRPQFRITVEALEPVGSPDTGYPPQLLP